MGKINRKLESFGHVNTARGKFHAYSLRSLQSEALNDNSRRVNGWMGRIRMSFNPIKARRLTVRLSNGSVPSKCAANRWLNVQDISHNQSDWPAWMKFCSNRSQIGSTGYQPPDTNLSSNQRQKQLVNFFTNCREFRKRAWEGVVSQPLILKGSIKLLDNRYVLVSDRFLCVKEPKS